MSELRKPYRPGNEEEIPAGLEYRPEMWDSALGLIENHEKVVFRRKLIAAAGIVLLLALGTGFWDRNVSSDGAQMAQQQDVFYAELRDSQDARSESELNTSEPEEAIAFTNPTSVENPLSTAASQTDTQNSLTQAIVEEEEFQSIAAVSENNSDHVEIQSTWVEEIEQDETVDAQTTSAEVIESVQVNTPTNTQTFDVVQEVISSHEPSIEVDVLEIAEENSSTAEVAEADGLDGSSPADSNETTDATKTNLHEGILSVDATIGGEAENPIPLNIKQTNEEDSPLQYEPFAEGAPAPHAFSTEFMGLGQELAQMDPRPYALIANSTDFKKPQGVIVNLKTKELLLPLQQFNVQVMLGTSILTHYGSRKQELALSPAAGVGIDYNFKRRLSLNAQLEYFSVKNIQRDRVVVQEEINFALATTTFTYNTEKLHYLSIPVNLAIRLKSRHQLSLGGGVSYMVAANNKVKVEEESSVSQAKVSEFDAKNVADGFAPVNTYLNFGYNYYVTPNVTLGLRYQVGLTDVTLDNSGLFNNNRKDRNTRLAAYVRFNVF